MRPLWPGLLVTIGVCLLGECLPAQEEENPRSLVKLTAQDEARFTQQAARLLEAIHPVVEKSASGREPWKVLELPGGSVRWGSFLQPGEVSALVNVAPPGEDSDIDPLPQYLILFGWKKDHWEFRQFLGNAYNLEVHYRRDHPSVFLQGSYKMARNEGEFVSWFLDERNGRLERTHFEDWGPFYLKGNYLVRERGFERRAHDDTRWIYPYKDGKMGPLLARFHSRDNGEFDILVPEPKSPLWQGWNFQPDEPGGEGPMTVTLLKSRDLAKLEDQVEYPEESGVKGKISSVENFDIIFTWLTGLNSDLLEGGWSDELPPAAELSDSFQISGDPEIVHRLQPLGQSQERRVVDLLREITPALPASPPVALSQGHFSGILGAVFDSTQPLALVAEEQTWPPGVEMDANLFLLRWQNGWKFQQNVGSVARGGLTGDQPGWAIKNHGISASYYVISRLNVPAGADTPWWRYNPATQKLEAQVSPVPGLPSLAGDTLTISRQELTPQGWVQIRDMYQAAHPDQPRLAEIRQWLDEGHLFRADVIVPGDTPDHPVTWHLRKVEQGYQPHADRYVVSRDEDQGQKDFREDASLTFDWGSQSFGPEGALAFFAGQLAKVSANAVAGCWDSDTPDEAIKPVSVKVTGLPEAVKLFSWPAGP